MVNQGSSGHVQSPAELSWASFSCTQKPREPRTILILSVATRGLRILTVSPPEPELYSQLSQPFLVSLKWADLMQALGWVAVWLFGQKPVSPVAFWYGGFYFKWPQGEVRHKGVLQQDAVSPRKCCWFWLSTCANGCVVFFLLSLDLENPGCLQPKWTGKWLTGSSSDCLSWRTNLLLKIWRK